MSNIIGTIIAYVIFKSFGMWGVVIASLIALLVARIIPPDIS